MFFPLSRSLRFKVLEFGACKYFYEHFVSSMIGDQMPAPSSPRDGDDVTITVGHPQVLIG